MQRDTDVRVLMDLPPPEAEDHVMGILLRGLLVRSDEAVRVELPWVAVQSRVVSEFPEAVNHQWLSFETIQGEDVYHMLAITIVPLGNT